jgi:hypothetical protein
MTYRSFVGAADRSMGSKIAGFTGRMAILTRAPQQGVGILWGLAALQTRKALINRAFRAVPVGFEISTSRNRY